MGPDRESQDVLALTDPIALYPKPTRTEKMGRRG